MARVGVTNMESYIRGVTTLHHYERISSRDLGLKELRIFGTEVVLALPGGFSVGMVRHMPTDGLSVWEPIEHRRCLETG